SSSTRSMAMASFFFLAVVTRTAELMAKWQAVGFAHGVMNTDNMSILGLTLDYGPFGFLDNYDPKYICNHSDDSGRYAFNRQPSIALWNLRHLAEALTSLNSMESMTEILNTYSPSYSQHLFTLMRNKLGLKEANRRTLEIVNDLFSLLEKNQPDYTRFFRSLSQFEQETKAENPIVRNQFIDRAAFNAWSIKYKQQLVSENSDNQKRAVWLNKNNPKYILRNHLAQQAIEKANDGDYSEISILQKLLHNPFDEHDDHDKYADLPPEWAKKISISCSS
ncbi:MAG TPA: hypothetical protein ENK06_02025, partial [Gammaproteobacteria bacterium]|nr:hypothetical protein [Gammaproteobacteria bacterium]